MSPTVPPISTSATSACQLLRRADDAPLDLVGDVGDDLDRPAEEVAAPFARDDFAVDLPGGHVVELAEVFVDEALVVAQIEVGLGAILGDEDLAVLVRRHRAGIDVEIGVEFLN